MVKTVQTSQVEPAMKRVCKYLEKLHESQLQLTMKQVDKYLDKIYDAKTTLCEALRAAYTMLNEMDADDREKFLEKFGEEARWNIGLDEQLESLDRDQKDLNEIKSKMEGWHK